jgi:hypothetical protein
MIVHEATRDSRMKTLTVQESEKGYFGTCPECHAETGEFHDHEYVNIGKAHFAVCEQHRKYWSIGWGLFSSWRDESPEEHEKNRALLAPMDVVEPVANPASWDSAGDDRTETFTVPRIPTLWFPSTYCGEFAGWDDVAIEDEHGGILTVRCPDDMRIRLRFRRDELERHGRAKSVDRHGRPDRMGFEAFVPGRWDVELDSRGCPARYVPRPEARPERRPSVARHVWIPEPPPEQTPF